MFRVVQKSEPRRAGEEDIAVAHGGPWDGRIVRFSERAAPGAAGATTSEWFADGVRAPDGTEFSPLPTQDPDQRTYVYCVGVAGAGQSYWAASYARDWCDTFSISARQAKAAKVPEQPRVTLICPIDPQQDESFREPGFDYEWVSLGDLADVLDGLAPGEDFLKLFEGDTLDGERRPSLVIFDDCERVANKRLEKALMTLSDAAGIHARKRRMHVVFMAHKPAAGKVTAVQLNESNAAWMSTKAGGSRNMDYWQTSHLGLPEGFRRMVKHNAGTFGRWIYLMHARPTKIAVAPLVVMRVDEDEIKDALDEEKDTKKAVRAARRTAVAKAVREAAADGDSDSDSAAGADFARPPITPFRARLDVAQKQRPARRGRRPDESE